MKNFLLILFLTSILLPCSYAQKKKPVKTNSLKTEISVQDDKPVALNLKEGNSYHVKLDEILYIRQQSSQVDSESVEPAWRATEYHFTESIEKVYPDGSAQIGSTLDSFTTKIIVGTYNERNEFFRFNSNNEYDVKNRLKDIRALPRAQFLGQTLRYTLGADGLVKKFQNLSGFQEATYARSFDYDMLHAMTSMADSLRVGQLLEYGFGAIAALSDGRHGKLQTPYTMTEIHVTRNLTAIKHGNEIDFTGTFTNVPDSIDYLEGIAFPMVIQHFEGFSKGSVTMKDQIAISGNALDTAKLYLMIPGDTIKCVVSRNLSFEREPIKMLRGRDVNIKNEEMHHTPPPKEENVELDMGGHIKKITPIYEDSTEVPKKN